MKRGQRLSVHCISPVSLSEYSLCLQVQISDGATGVRVDPVRPGEVAVGSRELAALRGFAFQ